MRAASPEYNWHRAERFGDLHTRVTFGFPEGERSVVLEDSATEADIVAVGNALVGTDWKLIRARRKLRGMR